MRFALAVIALLLAACGATAPRSSDNDAAIANAPMYKTADNFVSPKPGNGPNVPKLWTPPNERPQVVVPWHLNPHPVNPAIHRLEPMPFGRSSFGPWSVGPRPRLGAPGDSPDPEKPITADFMPNNAHSVLHRLCILLGRSITIEMEEGGALYWDDTFDKYEPAKALRAFAELNGLSILEDDEFIILVRR